MQYFKYVEKGKQFVVKKEKKKYYIINILKDWNVFKILEN